MQYITRCVTDTMSCGTTAVNQLQWRINALSKFVRKRRIDKYLDERNPKLLPNVVFRDVNSLHVVKLCVDISKQYTSNAATTKPIKVFKITTLLSLLLREIET